MSILHLSNDVKVSLDSVDLTVNSGTFNDIGNNNYGVLQNATYTQFGKIVVVNLEFLFSKKALPSYTATRIASGLPKPSAVRKCTGGIMDGMDCEIFYQIDTDGTLVLYNRSSTALPLNNFVRSYGLVYQI